MDKKEGERLGKRKFMLIALLENFTLQKAGYSA